MDARFSTRLQHAMHSAGLKQSDLIKLAQDQGVKLGKSQLSQYDSGKTVPRRDMLAALAGILQVDADWLRGAEVEPATIEPPAATPATTETPTTGSRGLAKIWTGSGGWCRITALRSAGILLPALRP